MQPCNVTTNNNGESAIIRTQLFNSIAHATQNHGTSRKSHRRTAARYLTKVYSHLNDIWFVIRREAEFLGHEAKRTENGAAKIGLDGCFRLLGNSSELDSLNLFLELPVVDKRLLPFGDQLSFKLFWKLHHFFFFFTFFGKKTSFFFCFLFDFLFFFFFFTFFGFVSMKGRRWRRALGLSGAAWEEHWIYKEPCWEH